MTSMSVTVISDQVFYLFYFRNTHKMNFARAVKGTMTRDVTLREVDSQSEIELGQHLDSPEKSILFTRFSPELVLDRIQQVLE